MTDEKEMLEYAAKAMGIARIKWHDEYPGGWLDGCGAPSTWWNPVTGDGDCARMEAALGINVEWFEEWVYCGQVSADYADHNGDKQKARRYASTRCAAEVGRAMA